MTCMPQSWAPDLATHLKSIISTTSWLNTSLLLLLSARLFHLSCDIVTLCQTCLQFVLAVLFLMAIQSFCLHVFFLCLRLVHRSLCKHHPAYLLPASHLTTGVLCHIHFYLYSSGCVLCLLLRPPKPYCTQPKQMQNSKNIKASCWFGWTLPEKAENPVILHQLLSAYNVDWTV